MSQVEELQASQGYRKNPSALTVTSVGMCVCWLASYTGMIRKSFQDRTYCMPLMPLCCDIAFEFIYSVIYPPMEDPILQYLFASWLALSVVVVFTAMRFAPNEWKHAPLIQRNISWIFAVSIVGWMTAHMALVDQFGPDDGMAWSGWFCQLFLSAGCLCQLIVRDSSRGTSLFIWLARFVGTIFSVLYFALRYRHGHVIWHSPLAWWGTAAFFVLDGSYGILLWHIQQSEKEVNDQRRRKAGSLDKTEMNGKKLDSG